MAQRKSKTHQDLIYPYQYTEDVVPPRCRKPRRVLRDATLKVRVPVVRQAEAPVAILEYDPVWRRTRTYRWFRRRLFILKRNRDGRPMGLEVPRANPGPYAWDSGFYQPRALRMREIRAWARDHVIIDGKVWEVCGEPRYVIMTFGLGGNHARHVGAGCGTALSTDTAYNSNISNRRYYRIDQAEAAVREAERIALARGDTLDAPIRHYNRFRIPIPEAIRLNPRRQHGAGDPFINKVERIIEATKSPLLAGVLAIQSIHSND